MSNRIGKELNEIINSYIPGTHGKYECVNVRSPKNNKKNYININLKSRGCKGGIENINKSCKAIDQYYPTYRVEEVKKEIEDIKNKFCNIKKYTPNDVNNQSKFYRSSSQAKINPPAYEKCEDLFYKSSNSSIGQIMTPKSDSKNHSIFKGYNRVRGRIKNGREWYYSTPAFYDDEYPFISLPFKIKTFDHSNDFEFMSFMQEMREYPDKKKKEWKNL